MNKGRIFTPPRLLGIWLVLSSVADIAVIMASMTGLYHPMPIPSEPEYYQTMALAGLIGAAGVGLLEHARWGWWLALVGSIISLGFGGYSFFISPPPNFKWLILTVALIYHGVIMKILLAKRFRAYFDTLPKKFPRWLVTLPRVVLFCGVGALVLWMARGG